MGLCKCSKRRVTNLFCFVHRVNVCEDCMVKSHPRCIVQSYLRWLEDSDYDAICALCTLTLQQGHVVRLVCYDLFHQPCLDRYVKTLLNQMQPSEVCCPKCKDQLIPADHCMSPVAQELRKTLKRFSWSEDNHNKQDSINIETEYASSQVHQVLHHHSTAVTDDVDSADNKYKRKDPVHMMSQWARNHPVSLSGEQVGVVKKYLVVAMFVMILVVSLILFLTRVGRGVAERDSALDWKYNPHLQTGD